MEVKTIEKAPFYLIEVKGELDASSALSLDNVLREAIENGNKKILVDFNELEYISSPGIGVFTSRIEECEKQKIQIILYGMSEKVQNVFKILGLDQLIPITSTEEDAKRLSDDLQKRS